MNCPRCQGAFVYTTYIRVMRRSEKTHRSRQTWQPVGRSCVNCGDYTQTLTLEMRRAIMTRRINTDRQLRLTEQDSE